MEMAISITDVFAACFFFTAAIISLLTDSFTNERTRLWRWTGLAYLLFAIDRVSNALEWGSGEVFAAYDAFQGYFSVLACLILSGLAYAFLRLLKSVTPREE